MIRNVARLWVLITSVTADPPTNPTEPTFVSSRVQQLLDEEAAKALCGHYETALVTQKCNAASLREEDFCLTTKNRDNSMQHNKVAEERDRYYKGKEAYDAIGKFLCPCDDILLEQGQKYTVLKEKYTESKRTFDRQRRDRVKDRVRMTGKGEVAGDVDVESIYSNDETEIETGGVRRA